MEDMVVVASRDCTDAVLVELVCAGLDHLDDDEGRAVEFTAAHTRSALPWATTSPAKSSGRFPLTPPEPQRSIQSSSLRPARMKMSYIRAPAVIARKLPYCSRYITVIRSNVLNGDHNGLTRP